MKRISFKLLIYTVILLFLIMTLNLLLQGNIITNSFKLNQKNRMIQYAKNISNKFLNNDDYHTEANNISNLINGRVSIYDSQGILIETFGSFMYGRTRNIENQLVLDVISGKTVYQTDRKTFQGSTIITLGIPIIGNKISGAVFIHIPSREIQKDVQDMKNQTFILFIVAIFISFIGAYILSSLFTNPILKITKAAKAISNGNYDIKIDIKNKDEIGELAKTINQMAKNLLITDKLKKDLIANLTHELRTPLSIIKSYAEAINDDILDKNEIKEYSYSIIEEAEHLNKLVNEILELSKLQSGAVKIHEQIFDLRVLFEEIINELSKIKGNRDIILEHDTVEIKGDKELLKRAFSNIIINAINHTNNQGKITIKIFKEDKIYISIKDDGEGISSEDLPYIFERFYRSDKKKGIGGLGLSIAQEIINMHNGSIKVLSQLGQGAEFIVMI